MQIDENEPETVPTAIGTAKLRIDSRPAKIATTAIEVIAINVEIEVISERLNDCVIDKLTSSLFEIVVP